MNPGLFYFYPDHQGKYPSGGKTPAQISQGRKRLLMGLLAGAAVAYVASNKTVRSKIASTGASAAAAARGEIEELTERLADTQAELDYLRSQIEDK